MQVQSPNEVEKNFHFKVQSSHSRQEGRRKGTEEEIKRNREGDGMCQSRHIVSEGE